MKKGAWVLQLKDSSKIEVMPGIYYFFDDPGGVENLTRDINKAEIIEDKQAAVEEMKIHEKTMIEKFGTDAIINAGYTSMMKHFDFVEVEIEYPK